MRRRRAQGRTARTASRTLSGPSRPASISRPSTAAARWRCDGSCSSHGRSTTRATVSPSVQQDGVASTHASFLLLVQLDEIGAGVLRLADEDGDAQTIVGHGEDLVCAARASLREDEAEHVGARLDCGVDVVATREAADLDERPREDLVQAGRRIIGAHQCRADQDRVGACELGRCSLRA